MKKLNITPWIAVKYNDHTDLPLIVNECENDEDDGSRSVTWDLMANDGDDLALIAEYSNPDDAAFCAHAWNTYYQREQALSEMAERIKTLDDALRDLLHHGMRYDNGETHQADPDKARALLTPPINEAHGHLLSNPE